jgi:hypothetical protein
MNSAIRRLAGKLLQRLSSLPISDVLSHDKGGVRVNPFREAYSEIARFRQLDDIRAHVEGFLSEPPPDGCSDPELFHDICMSLRSKFQAEYSFLLLLDGSRLQEALFQLERGLFPDLRPEHAAAARAKREFSPKTRPPASLSPIEQLPRGSIP